MVREKAGLGMEKNKNILNRKMWDEMIKGRKQENQMTKNRGRRNPFKRTEGKNE
jgi:hypothetical protein